MWKEKEAMNLKGKKRNAKKEQKRMNKCAPKSPPPSKERLQVTSAARESKEDVEGRWRGWRERRKETSDEFYFIGNMRQLKQLHETTLKSQLRHHENAQKQLKERLNMKLKKKKFKEVEEVEKLFDVFLACLRPILLT